MIIQLSYTVKFLYQSKLQQNKTLITYSVLYTQLFFNFLYWQCVKILELIISCNTELLLGVVCGYSWIERRHSVDC